MNNEKCKVCGEEAEDFRTTCMFCDEPEELSEEDKTIKKQYDEMNGIGSLDIGSRKMLLKQVLKLAKAKGYKVSAFYDCKEFPMERLRAVFHTLQGMN
jgi:hypothetical protein